MAKSSAVSDTQALLQSMLQKLKLQNHSERSSTPTQEQAPSPTIGLNGGSSLESTVYQFGDPSKLQGTPPSIWTNLDNPWRLQSPNQPHLEQSTEVIPSTLAPDVISDGEMPRWERKQLKISPSKVSDDSCSLSSISTTENTLNSTDLSTPSPTSSIPSRRTSEEHSDHSGVCGEGVGDIRKDSINVSDKIMRTRTSRTSKRKWEDPGKKRWTQKVKERWKERHKKERDGKQKQEPNRGAKNDHCPTPTKSSDDNTTATLSEQNISYNSTIATVGEQNTIHPEPINNGLDEAPPSPPDHMSESIFSFGSFNLMEEIFAGKEWANFFQTNTCSQPEFTCITADKTTESPSSISQSPYREHATGNQWDYKEAADSNLRTPSSQMNSESFQQDMDITEQTRTSDFSLALSRTFEFLEDQSELFASSQIQSMDLGLSQSGNDEQTKYQPQLLDPHQHYQLNTAEASYHQLLSSEQNLNQAQQSDPNHTQPETVHEELLPLLDLSYLQPKDSSSLRKLEILSRKRGHCTLRRGSSDRGRSETGEVDEWRDNAPLYSLHPAPSLSPASSISSLQYSISQDSESSASTETVVKKRRLENTRRVRFAEEVVFVPPLVLSEDYDDDNDDYDNEEDGEASDEDEDDVQEEPQSRPSVPNWFVALRTKTKRKPKLKLPQMASKPTKFKSSKL